MIFLISSEYLIKVIQWLLLFKLTSGKLQLELSSFTVFKNLPNVNELK